jgi:hypothetical protein
VNRRRQRGGIMNLVGIPLLLLAVPLGAATAHALGGAIALSPTAATLTPGYQIFYATDGNRIEAVNDFAPVRLKTDVLDRLAASELITGHYFDVAEKLSLTSVEGELVGSKGNVCRLSFYGFGVSRAGNEAVYRCKEQNIAGSFFERLLLKSTVPTHIKDVSWQDFGK